MNNKCLCGCGEYAKVGNKYINGHNAIVDNPMKKDEVRKKCKEKIEEYHKKPRRELSLCLCGCGGQVTRINNKFIHGHCVRVNQVSTRPEVKKKIGKSTKERWQNPEYKMQISEKTKEQWKNEEHRRKQKEMMKQLMSDTQRRKQASNFMKKRWEEDDDYRERVTNASKDYHNRPEVIEEQSKRHTVLWSNPKFRQETIEAMNSLDVKHKHSMSTKLYWASLSPEEIRDRVLPAMQALHIKPNKCEQLVNSLLQTLFPGVYSYVGNGEIWIEGKNPDFININNNLIIEFFGRYWHLQTDEATRINYFRQFGYDTLVIWEDELRDLDSLSEKILEFHNRGGIFA